MEELKQFRNFVIFDSYTIFTCAFFNGTKVSKRKTNIFCVFFALKWFKRIFLNHVFQWPVYNKSMGFDFISLATCRLFNEPDDSTLCSPITYNLWLTSDLNIKDMYISLWHFETCLQLNLSLRFPASPMICHTFPNLIFVIRLLSLENSDWRWLLESDFLCHWTPWVAHFRVVIAGIVKDLH